MTLSLLSVLGVRDLRGDADEGKKHDFFIQVCFRETRASSSMLRIYFAE